MCSHSDNVFTLYAQMTKWTDIRLSGLEPSVALFRYFHLSPVHCPMTSAAVVGLLASSSDKRLSSNGRPVASHATCVDSHTASGSRPDQCVETHGTLVVFHRASVKTHGTSVGVQRDSVPPTDRSWTPTDHAWKATQHLGRDPTPRWDATDDPLAHNSHFHFNSQPFKSRTDVRFCKKNR